MPRPDSYPGSGERQCAVNGGALDHTAVRAGEGIFYAYFVYFQVFPMSVLACLGNDAAAVRDTYLARLQSVTEVRRNFFCFYCQISSFFLKVYEGKLLNVLSSSFKLTF